ncbi:MAG: molybdopterin-dependent oxidoreductase [Deltaproteobacteria bacterium]|nr:molybdopterin-dependent oxidoreductase [Deltaproteobacteria bacterium]
MQEELRVVGKRVPVKENFDKVQGKADYCATITLPGMLVGKLLHSPHAHARVVSVDTSRAEGLQGVKAVVTKKDDPRKIFTWNVMTYQLPDGEPQDQYIFDDVVRYVGEPVAAVAAVNEEIAKKAVDLIEVEYDVLPAVFSVEDAVKKGAPRVHDTAENNIGAPPTPVFCYGDVEKDFSESDTIVEGVFSTSKQSQAGLENAGCVAEWRNGRLTVWSQAQLPHMTKRMIAQALDIPESTVRVIQPFAGTGFGAGTDLCPEPYACLLTMKAGAPVKVALTRSEDLRMRFTREHIVRVEMKMGVKKDGTPMALKAKYTGDAGAYMGKILSGCGVALASNITEYEFKSMYQEIEAIYTHHLACGAMRGFGGMQSTFAREILVDEVCEKIGMNPIEFRKKYHRGVGGLGWFPDTKISSCGLDACLDVGAERIGWKGKWQGWGAKKEGIRRRGVGVAAMGWLSGAQPMLLEHTNATLKFNSDGTCTLIGSPGLLGQGVLAAHCQIAAEVLGIDYDDVRPLTPQDTDITGFDIGTHASRGCYCIGRAVEKAAQQARELFLERASKKLGVAADALDIKERRIFCKDDPEKGIEFREIAQDTIYSFGKDCRQITVNATIEPTEFAPPWQAGFAEVEVDTETGVVEVIKMIIAHDIGRAINPTVVEGQLEGGQLQGIGFALFEDIIISSENGVNLTDSFNKYKIASMLDCPDHEALLVELGDPTGPFSAKSCGESGIFLQAPAIANAIYDAVGIRLRDVPMTPERVLAALKNKSSTQTN